jgi:hypothetical protein
VTGQPASASRKPRTTGSQSVASSRSPSPSTSLSVIASPEVRSSPPAPLPQTGRWRCTITPERGGATPMSRRAQSAAARLPLLAGNGWTNGLPQRLRLQQSFGNTYALRGVDGRTPTLVKSRFRSNGTLAVELQRLSKDVARRRSEGTLTSYVAFPEGGRYTRAGLRARSTLVKPTLAEHGRSTQIARRTRTFNGRLRRR